MSEISRLNHTGDAIAMPAMAPTHTSGQRFQQLIAQTPQEEADNNSPWDKAAELLTNTQYTDPSGTPQAYVNNGTLTEAGKSRLETAQDHLRHTTGATEVSIEQGAKQLLIEALTTQYANENNPALLQKAQQLQTELYSELTPSPSEAPQDANTEPTAANLEPYLESQLQQLGLSRTEFEASTIDLGNGEVPISALLATETEPRGQLQLLISIAAQQLRAQQVAAAQVPAAEPPAPPVVEPVKVTEIMKLQPGELYEFSVEELAHSDNVLNVVFESLEAWESHSAAYGSTYHLQFIDANGEIIHLAPVLETPQASTPEGSIETTARVTGISNVFRGGSDQMSVYWHGESYWDAPGIERTGTTYSVGGYMAEMTDLDRLHRKVPIMMVETKTGIQRLRLDEIPFAKVRVSNEGNKLHTLPTQADVLRAEAALEQPENLTLTELLQNTQKSLARVNLHLAAKISAASSMSTFTQIIENAYANAESVADVETISQDLLSVLQTNPRNFENRGTGIIARLGQLQTVRLDLAARAPDRDFGEIGLGEKEKINLVLANLSGLDLSGVVWHFVDLSGANLKDTNLQGAHLNNSNLRMADLQRANLRDAKLEHVNLGEANLSHADLSGADLKRVAVDRANFSEANLSGANLYANKFVESNMAQADLSGADLISVQFVRSSLHGANFSNANLSSNKFVESNMAQADLSGAGLRSVQFIKSSLLGANLSDANLQQADFYRMNLDGTQWENAILSGVKFREIIKFDLSSANTNPALKTVLREQGVPIFSVDPSINLTNVEDILSSRAPGRGFDDIGFETGDLVNLRYRDLSGVDLSDVVLENIVFTFANLSNVNLQRANLREILLEGANLTGANLSHIQMADVDLSEADLSAANLEGAIVSGVELADANLTNANLNNARLSKVDLTAAVITGASMEAVEMDEVYVGGILVNTVEELKEALAELPDLNGFEDSQTDSLPNFNIDTGSPDPDIQAGPQSSYRFGDEIVGNGLGVSGPMTQFGNPNGLTDPDEGTQSGHQPPNNNSSTITAVAGDAPEPDKPFQVVNGEVVISGIRLPELDLSRGSLQNGGTLFGVPAGLRGLPRYSPTPRSESQPTAAQNTPVADTSSESPESSASQPGGVTIGGQLGSKGEAEKANSEMEQILGKGWRQGLRPDLFPTPIDSRIPGFGEGLEQPSLDNYNTGWGIPGVDITLENETFPETDAELEKTLRPNGEAGPTFISPRSREEIPAAEYQAVVKALPALQQISVGEYSQLSAADQKNILSRAVEYQSLPADIKANTTLLQYADSGQTSASQRGQMLGVQQKQTVQTSQQILSDAQSGLSDSTLQLINSRINALQRNTAAINQQTQALTQSNANRQNALAAPTTSDPVTAAFIKPDIKPGQTPPASNSAPASQISSQSSPIPRFMVVRTANGPQLMENLPNGKTQMLPYPIPADTPVTRQASNGSWTHVPDAYAIGAKNLLDTLFLQSTVKMLNGGNAVQTPGVQNAAPQSPNGMPQPAF